jgi:CheY-like chemotaxis protein
VSTVLVVDADRVSRRFAELALANTANFVVELANDAHGALDVASRQLIDLIVCETTLPDATGLQLYRQLLGQSRFRDLPFIFLSSDTRAQAKVQALKAGVEDYLCKPCDSSEFAARVSAVIDRRRRQRIEARNKAYTLAGNFSTVTFPDLVSIIGMGQRTGVLAVSTERALGRVFFERGEVIHAEFGTLSGNEAFYRYLAEHNGEFEFTQGERLPVGTRRSITLSATALIMEGARRFDDERESHRHGASKLAPETPSASTDSTRVPPVAEDPNDDAAARFYELALSDAFVLGELRLVGEDQLADFTADAGAPHRLHVWLVADREEAIGALLPLAGPPSERLLLEGLQTGSKALSLVFHLRDERMLDVLLLDAAQPAAYRRHLRRCPSVVVYAPPRGDILAVSIPARLDLKTLCDEFCVRALVAMGQPTLSDGLARVGLNDSPSRVMFSVKGTLADPSSDLRRVLVEAVHLWQQSEEKKVLTGTSLR